MKVFEKFFESSQTSALNKEFFKSFQTMDDKISSTRSWKCCTRLCKILIFISKLSYESLWKSWNVFENHLKKEFFKTTKFLVDDHKIVAQDYVQSSNFDSNINYLIEEIDYRIFAFKEPLFIKSRN